MSHITNLTPEELEKKYGNLPKTERETAMWHSGYRAGKNDGRKKFRDDLLTLIGVDERLEKYQLSSEDL